MEGEDEEGANGLSNESEDYIREGVWDLNTEGLRGQRDNFFFKGVYCDVLMEGNDYNAEGEG